MFGLFSAFWYYNLALRNIHSNPTSHIPEVLVTSHVSPTLPSIPLGPVIPSAPHPSVSLKCPLPDQSFLCVALWHHWDPLSKQYLLPTHILGFIVSIFFHICPGVLLSSPYYLLPNYNHFLIHFPSSTQPSSVHSLLQWEHIIYSLILLLRAGPLKQDENKTLYLA